MLTISIDELEHMEDPIAVLVWKRWIRQGKARLIVPQSLRTNCKTLGKQK